MLITDLSAGTYQRGRRGPETPDPLRKRAL